MIQGKKSQRTGLAGYPCATFWYARLIATCEHSIGTPNMVTTDAYLSGSPSTSQNANQGCRNSSCSGSRIGRCWQWSSLDSALPACLLDDYKWLFSHWVLSLSSNACGTCSSWHPLGCVTRLSVGVQVRRENNRRRRAACISSLPGGKQWRWESPRNLPCIRIQGPNQL